MPAKRKVCLLKSYYMSTLTCGAVTWAWTKATVSKQTAAEMRLLKIVVGKIKRKRI
jgi:hypothetical protein